MPDTADGSLTFIGNATTLLRWGPFTLLTDPNFLHRGQLAYLGHGLVSRRRRDPALQLDELPARDAVLLSHMHGDHWDRVARHGLDRRLPIVTTTKAAGTLRRRQGFEAAVGLRTWEEHTLRKDGWGLRVTSLPGRHAPGPAQWLLPPVMGSLLELLAPDGGLRGRIYVTGDTLMYDGVREIARRFRDIDLTVIHLGGTTLPAGLPGGLMVTMDGEQGAELLATVLPRKVAPVHYDDYGVFRSGLPDFLEQVERRGLSDRVLRVDRGETVAFGTLVR